MMSRTPTGEGTGEGGAGVEGEAESTASALLPLRIREFKESDRELLVALAPVLPRTWMDNLSSLQAWSMHPQVCTWVAAVGEEAVGVVMVGFVPILGGSWRLDAEILAIAVLERFRRRGAGRALMRVAVRRAEQEARVRPVYRLGLHTAADNVGAQALFSRFGFSPVARRKGYYGEGMDAVRMVRAIVARG